MRDEVGNKSRLVLIVVLPNSEEEDTDEDTTETPVLSVETPRSIRGSIKSVRVSGIVHLSSPPPTSVRPFVVQGS